MIISVSRRTDIPAFYSDWFFNRIDEGFVYVKNPFNRKQVSRIELNPDIVDCFVFWSKDPQKMIARLDELDERGYKYYFQFTLNSYGNDIEKCTRKKSQIIKTFISLSEKIGAEKVIWRYDPILINEYYTKEYHYKWFEEFCRRLKGYTHKCVISFLDLYDKTKRNTVGLNLKELSTADMNEIAERLSSIALKYDVAIETCSEVIDLEKYNIKKGKCIDDKLIGEILGADVSVKKDDTQREECGCVKSIDIGAYNTCRHFCAYCYANYNYDMVEENCRKYDAYSPLLVDKLLGDEKVTERKMVSVVEKQKEDQLRFDI